MTIPKPGDRIRLIDMPDDPDPIPAGTEGTVLEVNPHVGQVIVKWDIPRSLHLVLSVDSYEILEEA